MNLLRDAIFRRDDVQIAALLEEGWLPDPWDAAALGRLDVLNAVLVTNGEIAWETSEEGLSLLHFASLFADAVTVKRLVTAGCQLDGAVGFQPHDTPLRIPGFTALHAAASVGQRAIVDVLLAAGANPRIRTPSGLTPADVAVAAGFPTLAESLGGPTVAPEQSAMAGASLAVDKTSV